MPTARPVASPTTDDAPADFTFGLHQRMFDPLPATHARRRRVLEVRRYRGPPSEGDRPRWNMSTIDEAHPFPERACMHTVGHYDGVEVVDTHFPATVKGTTALRISADPATKTKVWTDNQRRAQASDRHTFQLTSRSRGQDREEDAGKLSYLARVVVEDNVPEKKQRRQGWCGSYALDGHFANRHVAPATEPVDYPTLNKSKKDLMASVEGSYASPAQRTAARNRQLQQERTLRKEAADVTPLSSLGHADAPKTFTMSNIDSWWGLDPVEVAAEQLARKHALEANPFYESDRSTVSVKR